MRPCRLTEGLILKTTQGPEPRHSENSLIHKPQHRSPIVFGACRQNIIGYVDYVLHMHLTRPPKKYIFNDDKGSSLDSHLAHLARALGRHARLHVAEQSTYTSTYTSAIQKVTAKLVHLVMYA